MYAYTILVYNMNIRAQILQWLFQCHLFHTDFDDGFMHIYLSWVSDFLGSLNFHCVVLDLFVFNSMMAFHLLFRYTFSVSRFYLTTF